MQKTVAISDCPLSKTILECSCLSYILIYIKQVRLTDFSLLFTITSRSLLKITKTATIHEEIKDTEQVN